MVTLSGGAHASYRVDVSKRRKVSHRVRGEDERGEERIGGRERRENATGARQQLGKYDLSLILEVPLVERSRFGAPVIKRALRDRAAYSGMPW